MISPGVFFSFLKILIFRVVSEVKHSVCASGMNPKTPPPPPFLAKTPLNRQTVQAPYF